ncbi:hypothetical protein ACA910_021666 [Epithemia clementina (nom. ined.)]
MYNRVALVEQQQQHRHQKLAPPIVSGMNPYHRQDSNPKPFDESSEEPSDTSTQHAQHSIYQISSVESGSTNNNNHHNHYHHYHHTNSAPKLQQQQQQQREPPQQPPQNKPRWDSSDRHQFPSMDIERMKNKLQRLRAGNTIATRSSSSSSEHAQAPRTQAQSSSKQTSLMSISFLSDSAYTPFATTISSSSNQLHPKQSSIHASSSPLSGNAAYNPFGDDPPPSSWQQQPKPQLQTTTTRRPHTERLSEATFNPFAALVKAVSSDPRTNDDANQPAATTSKNTTIPSSFNKNNNNNHPKSFNEPSDGSSSGGGSKVDGQSAHRGRIWSSPPTRRQDILDEASLGENGVSEGYRRNHNQTRSISEERSQQRRQQFKPRSKSVPRPKYLDRGTSVGFQNSSSVEQSLVQVSIARDDDERLLR